MLLGENTTVRKNLQRLARTRAVHTAIVFGLLYLAFAAVQIPLVFRATFDDLSNAHHVALHRRAFRTRLAHAQAQAQARLDSTQPASPARPDKPVSRHRLLSSLALDRASFGAAGEDLARAALAAGTRLWAEADGPVPPPPPPVDRAAECPGSVSAAGSDLLEWGHVAAMPCGLTLGSSVTVVGRPRAAREMGDRNVSEFRVELVGLRAADGEEPPAKVLHLNPRLKGDWSGRPVIELNTCFRMQWGSALRCQGWGSTADEETVDGKVKCEKWIQGDGSHLEEAKATWWLNRLVGSRTKKVVVDWPFPFAEEKLFVLTISARLEGYHINVDGRHVASFPYRTGFTLEDATGISVSGDVDVHSVFAASLPSVHPSFAAQQSLEMSSEWRAPPVPEGEVELFVGILSAGNHFAERMAVRKTWMQHDLIKSSNVVARFFVALNARKEVNVQLKKEAEFFGDIVIVPYLDNYDLVVLKTVAICEHGIRSMSAKNIMKCDDDTFVNLDAVLSEARKIPEGRSFYVGNINYFHTPLRSGKWAVTPEEWAEEFYPPYANGPGYIMSSDIANFTVSEFEANRLRLFKMEDVSMGMWVEKFNSTRPVEYVHSQKFCQPGCVEDYYTAHYQSPKQMICMWEKLQRQIRPQCCDMR